jgi:ABC-type multidrug transport system fused ATPase/permease subunit
MSPHNGASGALSLIERERFVIRELGRLAAERSQAEKNADAELQARKTALEAELQELRARAQAQFETERAAVEKEYQDTQRQLSSTFQGEYAAVETEYNEVRERLVQEYEDEKERLEKKKTEAIWSANTVHEAARLRLEEQLEEVEKKTAEAAARAPAIQKQADTLLEEWNQDIENEKSTSSVRVPPGTARQIERIGEKFEQAEQYLTGLRDLSLPRIFKGERLLGIFVLGWAIVMLVLAIVLGLLTKMHMLPVSASGWPRGWYIWPVVCTVFTALICVILRFWLANKARAEVDRRYQPLCQALTEIRVIIRFAQDEIASSHPRLHAENRQRYQSDLQKIEEKYSKRFEVAQQRFEGETKRADKHFPRKLAELKQRYDTDLRGVNGKYPPMLQQLKQRTEATTKAALEQFQQATEEAVHVYQEARAEFARHWNQGLERVQEIVSGVGAEDQQLFPDCTQIDWPHHTPPATIPPALRFGQMQPERSQFPDAHPVDTEICAEAPESFNLPALLPFPSAASLLLKAVDAGRDAAIQVLQTTMLRYLTTLPPGKVRFTIIDPVGLGENFSSFMHLADSDEALVNSRIWTEPAHIEQRLADLTEHMENVIQKYLRNQFKSIAEYNEQAGEVAEPYRVLVIANFPVNFTEAAARRLVSIAASGAGCGVYTLVSVDMKMPMPPAFQLKDLEPTSTTLVWKDNQFTWKDNDFGRFPLVIDAMPDPDTCTTIFQVLGEQARIASRVEVPFSFIAPPKDGWWGGETRSGVRVPLGRAGATKLQYLDLGRGTSQHVLIAGKTGSGKSTLLHALVTNLAMHFSPREVEFYLIDFKKGVEFKTYATHELPHARVVAIESEREFGLSVLQRLDAELRRRGECFRAAGVQDLPSYRQERPDEVMPRVLLIVDEFQEFFTEDDKISQEVSLLLDRLVRQGRAFGIHVLLGSQTLGGAYSLARSTLGQMAVRIALQCSETDAGLILAEDNTAARLLSRPGEAIYNDANGRVEGNDFFQVVWLPDEEREGYLEHCRELAQQQGLVPDRPQIVFEGNTPAEIVKNHLLRRVLEQTASTAPLRSVQAWLGEAIAIKDPTAAVFRAQSGSNLLTLGQQEEPALAVTISTLLSLAAQHRGLPEPARFFILDGTLPDDSLAGYLPKLSEMLPMPAKVGGFREIAGMLGEIVTELERRQQANDFEGAPIYLFVHGLQRFRDLRRAEDDFGFGREDKAQTPAQQFTTVLREGPAFNIHVLAWCDSLTNVQRALDRQGLREFELKVLFQMSATDSGMLIDSPAASKLGLHRALFYSEERGQPEKFRPYGLPPAEWLDWVRERLRATERTDAEPAEVSGDAGEAGA